MAGFNRLNDAFKLIYVDGSGLIIKAAAEMRPVRRVLPSRIAG